MKKLILFGGTFDPPHNGHMALLREAVRTVQPDLVLVMPTGIPPHKAGGHTSAALRLAMCRCFLPLAPRVRRDAAEIRRAGKSYTVDTVRLLRRRYPGMEIYLPMGSDMLLYFRQWREYKALLHLVTLVVQCRAEEDEAPVQALAESLRQEGARIVFTKGCVREISSTQVRTLAHEGKSVAGLVPRSVARTIARHGLYREESNPQNIRQCKGNTAQF